MNNLARLRSRLWLLLAFALPASGVAATYTVTTTANEGSGSLRQAIFTANTLRGDDTPPLSAGSMAAPASA